ncbi:alpha/beta hydrolase [Phenylobacterium sp.]|uniref:alpha/beta hydrolase n=1 Tax=Phenylobacterium sp. TaxID=1871053 RepID=UPI001201A7BF|nr:alpha/beta hydrolase [Phenylobacterium sp.]THD59342.1 MAG: alpha/beta hydrolase [Phenylobacterium sp.]
MQTTVVQTGLGPIPLWAPPGALTSAKPMVLVITGAWAPADEMIRTAQVVGPAWDAAVMRLPGNGTPVLAETSVAAWGGAVSDLIGIALAGRPVMLVGLSIGALVALAVRHPRVARIVALEPPLDTGKLWPLAERLQARWRETPADRTFLEAVFGQGAASLEGRTYGHLFAGAPPADVALGEVALYPERPLPRFPSFVDTPEREWLARQPGVALHVAPGAGHNIHVFAAPFLRDLLLAAMDKALAEAEP